MVLDRLLLIPDSDSDYTARQRCGERMGIVGICFNLVLFALKLSVGMISGAVSVIADALNNLSDAGTSLAMLFGFRIAGHPADAEHPFGHGRAEYLAGLFVAGVILLVGIELFQTSVQKIIHPEELNIGGVGVMLLSASLLLKVLLGWMYYNVGTRIQSSALKAAATDSLTDCLATSAVLIALGAYTLFGINIDGYAGIIVSGFILYSGWEALKAATSPLMGEANDPQLAVEVRRTVMKEPGILGVHDLVLHGYGVGRTYATLHIELPAKMPLIEAHALADRLERKIYGMHRVFVTVHIDPVVTDNPEADRLYVLASRLLTSVDTRLSIHDFHIEPYKKGHKIYFEVSCPEDFGMSDRELRRAFLRNFLAQSPNDRAVVRVDHHFC